MIKSGWVRTIAALWGAKPKAKQLALYPDGREELPMLACEAIRVQLDKIELRRPRQWGKLFGAKYDVLLYGLTRLWASLHELRNRKHITRDDLLMHIGALKKEAGRDFGLVRISIPNPQEPVYKHTFHFELDRERLRRTLRREGRYLLRSNMQSPSPETVWESYLLLARIKQACKDLKGLLSIRPIWHQFEKRIESHIFVSFWHNWGHRFPNNRCPRFIPLDKPVCSAGLFP